MNKNSKIALLFLSTAISLIIIIITYYGFDRYVTMYLSSTDRYLKKYNNLSSLPKDKKVIISFSTTQDRLKKIKPMMNSILDQTVQVDNVNMNLPPKKENYIIPREYKDICNVHYLGKDYGKCNNLIPTLLTTKDKGTKIINLNDDVIYGKDFIEQMVAESNKYPSNAIISSKNNEVYAILVKPEFFSIDVIDNNQKYFDESWITSHLINAPKELKYTENYKKI
jgi:hypothetical protein